MDKEELALTRKDFADSESWLRHCHEGGIDLAREVGGDFAGIVGSGQYAARMGAIYGQNRSDYLRSWEGWGVSTAVRWRQFVKGFEAIAFANCMGLVLDSSIDITWSLQGITSDLIVAERQKAFLDALRRWFERHGERAAYYWVLERGTKRGLHTHLTLHVPPKLVNEFNIYSRRTLARIVGRPLHDMPSEQTMLFQPRAGKDTIRQWKRFTYVMKGLDQTLMRIDKANLLASIRVQNWSFIPFKSQGEIAVKRMGVSRFLDDASRRRWCSVNEFPAMAIGDNGPPLDDRYIAWHRANCDGIVDPASA